MNILGSGAAQLNILFQISSYRTIIFDFGLDVSSWTFEFILRKNKGDRIKILDFTLGSGLSFPVYLSHQVQATFSSTNTKIEEGEYYYELRRLDLNIPLINGLAYFTFDALEGTESTVSLSLTVSSQTLNVSISNISAATFTLTTTGTSGPSTYSGGVLNIPQYSGGGSVSRDTMGDANKIWTASKTIVGITAAFTLPRTITLPLANSVTAGTVLTISDEIATLTPTNYLSILRAGSDVINGLTSYKVTGARSFINLESDGTSKWIAQVNKNLYQIISLSSNIFTLDFQNEENAFFECVTAITANFTNQLSNNSNGRSFEQKIKINGTSLTMTCPSSWTMQVADSRWNSGTQIFTFTGTLTNLYFNICGTYNVDRSKWEVVVSTSDFQ